MKTDVHLWSYLAEFLECEMFQTEVSEKIETHIFSKHFVRKSCRLCDNVEKYIRDRQSAEDNVMRRMRFARRVTTATDTHSEYVILIALPRQQ